MINLTLYSTVNVQTGLTQVSVYANSLDTLALGGFSLSFDLVAITPTSVIAITPLNYTALGNWDLFDSNLSTGLV